ncbi:MAG: S49 family peptidase [Methylococcales bacterium]
MNQLARLSQRVFNTPLALHPAKAEVIIASLSERLGISKIYRVDGSTLALEPQALSGNWEGSNRAGYEVVGGIALIEISGTLVQKLGSLNPYSGMTGYDGIRQNIIMALQDKDVRAICLMIDSPGGEVAGCFDLADMIYAARGNKPIWSILDENAYSAAYAIASATDKIIVPRTGGVGSIGVITCHVDWSKAIAQAGLVVTFIAYGDQKTDGRPELPLLPEAEARYQADINTMGELFVATVARNRNLSTKAVKATQAGTFLGALGVEAGLADAVLAPDAAFQLLLKEIS